MNYRSLRIVTSLAKSRLRPNRNPFVVTSRTCSTEAIPINHEIDSAFPDKIVRIVDQIAELNLLEVSELNACLKSRLKISDIAPAVVMGSPSSSVKEEEDEDAEASAPVAVQTSFTLKLTGFEAAKKVTLIKELKAQVEGMNLVQAKKFVESAPAVIKADIGKDEAEKIKKALEEAGATCEIS